MKMNTTLRALRSLFLSAPLFAGLKMSAEQSAKLNVILIMADDVGYECFSAYGSKEFSTPRLDALAAKGMRFDQHVDAFAHFHRLMTCRQQPWRWVRREEDEVCIQFQRGGGIVSSNTDGCGRSHPARSLSSSRASTRSFTSVEACGGVPAAQSA